MKNKEHILFDDGIHKCIMFSFDDETHEDTFLSVNQYLIIQKESAILIDPGSSNVYYELSEAISRYIDPQKLKYIFFSHQDPDVAGSIVEWNISTPAKLIVSKLWIRFMGHYGVIDMSRIIPLDDFGGKITFGDNALHFIPAHFLHSPGNFSLYDSKSKILFSGDIGAAVQPVTDMIKEVDNFEEHLQYMENFHKRYMGSNLFAKTWVKHIKKFDIQTIAPQHGAVFKNLHVNSFLSWFEKLKCGSDYIDELYGV